MQLSRRQRGIVNDSATPFTETGLSSRSRSSSPTISAMTSSASSKWSEKRCELYSAMTEEERGLFDELQDEIRELRCLLAARDGVAESKVHLCLSPA